MRFRLGGVEFGGDSGPLIVTRFDAGAAEVRSSDTPNPQRDGSVAGREFRGARTWAFDIRTNTSDLAGAFSADGMLSAVWENPANRLPFAMVPLSYDVGNGAWKRVYGRPDKYSGVTGTVQARQGAGAITCDFRVLDPYFYDDAEQQVVLGIVPATTGGLMAPLKAPLSTVRSSAPRAGLLRVTGNAPAPVTVRFVGPVTNPWVRSSTGWEIGVSGSLAWDSEVVVDPIAGTVTRDGVPAPALLTRKSRVRGAVLQPGTNEITFGGSDPTGTAAVVLSWRNAYTSL